MNRSICSIRTMVLVSVCVGLFAAASPGAVIIDVKATSVTGAGAQILNGGKTANIPENGTVTMTIYVQNMETVAGGGNGLGGFAVSLRSGDSTTDGAGRERTGGALWPVDPTAADTVVNATASNNLQKTDFSLLPSDGTLADLPDGTTPKVDPNDTDIDLRGMGGTQDVAGGWVLDIGVGPTPVVLGTLTLTALDLDDTTRPFDREVLVNAFFTNTGGTNGGLVLKGLTSHDPVTNGIGGTNLGSGSIIGTAVHVVVIPEPAAMGLLVAGGTALLLRRRRRS